MPNKLKYTAEQIDNLLKDIHDGAITPRDLPRDLYFAIGDHLKQGLYEGYGGDLTYFKGEKLDGLLDLRDNIYLFSGAKTFQFTREAAELLTDADGQVKPFEQFRDEAMAVYGEYNESWLSAEYRTTIGQAQMADRWDDIQANKDVLPMLRFSTDGQPCPECEPFEDLTAPVDDPIWDIALPLLHYNCECIVISEDDTVEPTSDEDLKKLQPNFDAIDPVFRNNPGNSGEIFPKGHPYFSDVPKEYKEFAKTNFGLPIPEEPGFTMPENRQTVDDVMNLARAVAPELDATSEGIAEQYDGTVANADLKSRSSIFRKVVNELDGDLSQLKDALRTTVVVDYDKLDAVAKDLKDSDLFTRVKMQSGPAYFGYKGILANIEMKNGLIAEVQVNSPGMIYAKMPKRDALKLLGDSKYNAIAKKTGLPGGQGHKYYEQIRAINPATASQEDVKKYEDLVKQSQTYYKNFYGF